MYLCDEEMNRSAEGDELLEAAITAANKAYRDYLREHPDAVLEAEHAGNMAFADTLAAHPGDLFIGFCSSAKARPKE